MVKKMCLQGNFSHRKFQGFVIMDEDIDALLEAAFDKKGVSGSVLWVYPI